MPLRPVTDPELLSQLNGGGEQSSSVASSLLSSAREQYPYIKNADLSVIYSEGRGGNRQLEYWPAGEPGNKQYPRPPRIPIDKAGIEVFNENIKPSDIVADYVSHEAVNTDPKLRGLYEEFVKTVPESTMRKRYAEHRRQFGESRPYEQWKESTGMPEFFRGYTFNQWPNASRMYTAEQLQKLDAIKEYLNTDPAGRAQSVTPRKPITDPALLAELNAHESPPRSMGQELVRQGGLTARYAVEGILAFPGVLANVPGYIANKALEAVGSDYRFPDQNQAVSQLLTDAGLPEPETRTERLVGDTSRAVAGTGAAFQAASLASPAIRSVLQVRPDLQVSSAMASGASGGSVREEGGGAGLQMAAGMIGGVAGGTAPSVAAGAARGVGRAATTLTDSGRRVLAGRALNTAASNSARAIQNLDDAATIVPGSQPTAGQAAKDAGLAFFENRMRALGDTRFGNRLSAQNNARQTMLDTVADGGLPEHVQRLIATREKFTAGQRSRAFAQAQGKPINTQRILSDIDGLLADPDNAGISVQSALKSVRSQVEGKADARSLYAVRKEINRILEGRYVNSDESVLQYAGGQLAAIKSYIDDAISEVAPSWRTYLTRYAKLSKPIDRAKAMGEIRQRTSLAAPDVETGRDFLSQPKWRNVVANNREELAQTLTPAQMKTLDKITADLDRGAAATNSSSIKVPGSDTAANMVASGQISVANILGRALGVDAGSLPPALRTAARPLSFVYRLNDEAVRELIVDAMLDPKLAAQLMREGTPENVQAFAQSFRESATASGVGTVVGEASQ